MANLKNAFSGDNIKRFFLKHGEKLVLGFVCLFVVLQLSGTQWFSYSRRPGELVEKLQRADDTIKVSNWTPEEQEKFPALNVQDDVNQMLADISDRPWVFSTNYIGSVFGADEPRREPELVAVMDLRADAGRTILAKRSTMPETPTEPTPDQSQPRRTPEDGGLLERDDVAVRSTPIMAPGMEGGDEAGMNPYGRGSYDMEYRVQSRPGEYLLGDEGDGGMAANPVIESQPVRYISVRGVFDLRKQVQNYAKALNVSEAEATRLVEFLDFKLERQTADSKNGPWSDWEPVDIDVAKDYLNMALDFDSDVVSVGVRNPVLTMPLPSRLMGVWRNNVNHPAVKNFELSEAEIEAEAIFNREILEQARTQNKAIKQRRAPGGFSEMQLDVGRMQQDYFEQTDVRQITKVFDNELKGTPAEVKKKLMEKIRAQVSAVGNLVLYRYIDFDLQAGKSYRYRVLLVLRNPNYDQPIERLVHPSVAEAEVLMTPVSEPSNVASVSPDYAYFLSRVTPSRGIINEQAEMQIFQWYDKTGTMIRGNLTMEPGHFIGGTTKTYVLNPAATKFEEEDAVPFSTNDLLIDALAVGRLDSRLHSDLKLPRNLTRGELGVSPYVLVADQSGQLRELDPVSTKNSQVSYDDYYQAEKKPFEAIKDAAKRVVSGLDALLGEGGDEMAMDGMDGAGRFRGRRANATRLQRGAFRETPTD